MSGSGLPRLGASWVRVALSPVGALMPESCACCGQPATAGASLHRGRDGAALIVGYCADCLPHAARDGTRTLGVALASLLLGATLAISWPLLRVPSSLPLHLLAALLAAAIPILVTARLRPRPESGHGAWGRAAAFSGRSLLCASSDYAAELVHKNPAARSLGHAREPWFSPWMLSGPLLGVGLSLFTHDLYHARLRVLNLTGDRFELYLDGKRSGSVEPSSVESPSAGLELGVAAGSHRLETRGTSGEVLSQTDVTLKSGASHLYAPASPNYCFWLESVTYGRASLLPERSLLDGEQRFWTLPQKLDGWFMPPPSNPDRDGALSGGLVTVLRQAPCSKLPFRRENAGSTNAPE
ncbi:MAG TPA: hypothetical protein VGP93_05910 [Polyangiaceae bacterium]|nr:hypothetical protein [Polyangiaceae bacterium]